MLISDFSCLSMSIILPLGEDQRPSSCFELPRLRSSMIDDLSLAQSRKTLASETASWHCLCNTFLFYNLQSQNQNTSRVGLLASPRCLSRGLPGGSGSILVWEKEGSFITRLFLVSIRDRHLLQQIKERSEALPRVQKNPSQQQQPQQPPTTQQITTHHTGNSESCPKNCASREFSGKSSTLGRELPSTLCLE